MANQGIRGLRRFADGGFTTGPGPNTGSGSTTPTGRPSAAEIQNWIDWQGAQPADAFLMGTARTVGDFWNTNKFSREALEDLAVRDLGRYRHHLDGRPWEDPNWREKTNAFFAEQERQRLAGLEYAKLHPEITVGPGPNVISSGTGSRTNTNVSNTNINPNIGVQLPGITNTPGTSTQPTLGQWQGGNWSGQWKTADDVRSLFRQTPGANPNPTDADLQYYLQKGPEQLLKDVQGVRGANPTMAGLIDQQRAQQGLRFQGVYQPQYQNYANPLTMTNVSNYGTRPAPSAAYLNYASGNPQTPGGIQAMMQNIQNWAQGQTGANIGQIASEMQKYGINAADLQAAYSGGYGQNAPSLFNASLYASNPAMDAVRAQYAGIGRYGVGTGANQIDPSGLQYWSNQLQSGAVSPSQFPGMFGNAVNTYMQQNPYSAVSQYVNTYRGAFPGFGPTTSTPFTFAPPKAPLPTPTPTPTITNKPLGGFGAEIETGLPKAPTARPFMTSPIVTRSAQVRGAPIMRSYATGGIATLLKR